MGICEKEKGKEHVYLSLPTREDTEGGMRGQIGDGGVGRDRVVGRIQTDTRNYVHMHACCRADHFTGILGCSCCGYDRHDRSGGTWTLEWRKPE